MQFTPTTPRAEAVVTTTNDDVTLYELEECQWGMDGGFRFFSGVLVKTYDTTPQQRYPFTVQDKDGSTPVADELAGTPTGGDDKAETMDRAAFAILTVAIDPETGSTYLPAGTVS